MQCPKCGSPLNLTKCLKRMQKDKMALKNWGKCACGQFLSPVCIDALLRN